METWFLRSESPPEGQAKYWNNIPPTAVPHHTGSLSLGFYTARTVQTPTIPPPLADTVHTVFMLSSGWWGSDLGGLETPPLVVQDGRLLLPLRPGCGHGV